MQEVKMNKKYRSVYDSYLRSYLYELWDLYKNYSHYKYEAMEYCKRKCYELNGYDLKIIGGNSSTFSVGFRFEKNGIEYFGYITKDYNRMMKIEG